MMIRFLSALSLLFATLPACAKIDVHLKDFAEVHSRQVRLADIATLHSDSQQVVLEGLGKVLVTTIAHINQPQRIDVKQLERLIARQQPALQGEIQLQGASAVTVVLPGETVPAERIIEAASNFLRQELAQQPQPFVIRNVSLSSSSIAAPKGEVQLRPRLLGATKLMARMHVAVDVLVDDKRVDSVTASADVDMKMPIYRATHELTAGAALTPGDYEQTSQALQQLNREVFVVDPQTDLSNFRLRRTVAAGSVLYRADIEAIPHVARNQKVMAELKSNGIVIEKTVVAQSDGQLGQVIKVADSQTETMFSAKVVAHGRVEVK